MPFTAEKTAKTTLREAVKLLSLFMLSSVCMALFIEACGRRSLLEALKFAYFKPFNFACNVLPVMTAVCLSLFFRRRVFAAIFIMCVFGVLGIVNGIARTFRITPLESADFRLLNEGLDLFAFCFNAVQRVLIAIGLAATAALLIVSFLKSPKRRRMFKLGGLASLCMTALTCAALLVYGADIPENGYAELANAYDEYGFIYSFGNSVFSHGIKKTERLFQAPRERRA